MDRLLLLFQIPGNSDQLMHGSYDPWLVILSIIMAAGASFTAYQIASQSWGLLSRHRRQITILAASLVMGGGVWSMHFIGMLAFKMNLPVRYELLLTLTSILPSVVASWIALNLTIRRDLRPHQLVIGGLSIGLGIGIMHFTGMAAMQMPAQLRYDPTTFTLSIIVAVSLAVFSIKLRFGLKHAWGDNLSTIRLNLISGIIMGVAISGMHYTGMAATRFIKPENLSDHLIVTNSNWLLAISVTAVAIFIAILTLTISLTLKYKDTSVIAQSNESRLRAIMETAIDGIVTINSTGQVMGSNAAIENILDWKHEDLLGKNVNCLMPEPHRSRHDTYIERYLRTGEAHIIGIGREVDALHKDGRKVPVRLAIGHVRLPQEDLFVAFISDISERLAMEHDLIQAKNRAEQAAIARSTFLANMSHEIRTPMNAIIGFSDILMESGLSDEQHRQIATISSSARSLLHILNDVLDSAKLEKGKLELHNTDFSLTHEVDQVISTLALQASHKGLDLCISLSSELRDHYTGAPDRIRQVLTNIVGNAIKFTDHGRVDISITPDKSGMVVFQVQDTGIGMTPEQLSNIFEPFTQADPSTSRRFGGTGLGTTISKQLVELMGGSVNVSSELNVGTSFEFTLPLRPAEISETQQSESLIQLPPLKILVADDIRQNVDLLTLLLTKSGHQVIPATNGQEAFQQWEEHRPDVALMDIQMPVMDGLSACRAIRQAEKIKQLKETPIIAMTASVLVEDQLLAKEAGMNGFASKPIELEDVTLEISRVLGIKTTRIPANVKSRTTRPLHPLDLDQGLELWGDQKVLAEEIRDYLEQWTTKKIRLMNALKDHQFELLRQESHTLKGLTGNLAMTELSDLFDQLEQSAKSGKLNRAESLLAEIQAATEHVITELSFLKDDSRRAAQQDHRPHLIPLVTTVSSDLLQIIEHLMDICMRREHDEYALEQLLLWSGPSYQVQAKKVAAAFNNHEFETASELLTTIKSELTTKMSTG
ncbi:MHYT domain-containing protein [Hahella ganghwensis]|uniref:MHYT domain-containing protein n=1 Tax=Hahella ganghwensis TaxID=286420 RepID=UPI00036D2D11|nr:MHYT domain-containing protein [Hahella ganghwensis]